jgi:hypothetical protein
MVNPKAASQHRITPTLHYSITPLLHYHTSIRSLTYVDC